MQIEFLSKESCKKSHVFSSRQLGWKVKLVASPILISDKTFLFRSEKKFWISGQTGFPPVLPPNAAIQAEVTLLECHPRKPFQCFLVYTVVLYKLIYNIIVGKCSIIVLLTLSKLLYIVDCSKPIEIAPTEESLLYPTSVKGFGDFYSNMLQT